MGSLPASGHSGPVSPEVGDDWLALAPDALPSGAATEWAVLAGCGAVVSFVGTVRDHAEQRPGVTALEYEAYEEEVLPRLEAIAGAARESWPDIGRVALLHRTGALAVTDISVVVVVSAPHRGEAFEAARFCIDSVKATVPIWKRETWDGGSDWSPTAQPVAEVAGASGEERVAGPSGRERVASASGRERVA